MDTVTCKIMLSSVVVEDCRLLGSKCAGETVALVGCGILLEMEHWKCYCICWYIVKDSMFLLEGVAPP